MAKGFDILPPQRPKERASSGDTKSTRGGAGSCIILLVVLIFAFLLASALQNPEKLGLTKVPTNEKSKSNNSFELFNNDGGSSLTPTPKVLKVRLLNASGRAGELDSVKQMLTAASYTIEQAGDSQNQYDQTMVYFKANQSDEAKKLGDTLKQKYQITLQSSDTLADSYDFLVIIGKK